MPVAASGQHLTTQPAGAVVTHSWHLQEYADAAHYLSTQLHGDLSGGVGGKAPRRRYSEAERVAESRDAVAEIADMNRTHCLASKTRKALDSSFKEFLQYLKDRAPAGCDTPYVRLAQILRCWCTSRRTTRCSIAAAMTPLLCPRPSTPTSRGFRASSMTLAAQGVGACWRMAALLATRWRATLCQRQARLRPAAQAGRRPHRDQRGALEPGGLEQGA